VNLTQLWSKSRQTFKPPPKRRFDSIVLLLREPSRFTQEELEAAGSRAFGQPFNTSEDSAFILHQEGDLTLIKCHSSLINLLQAQIPYTPPNIKEISLSTDDHGRLAWNQHTAWIAFDLINDYDFSPEESFATLARWAQQFLGPNCTAAFIPSLGRTMVNNGAADRGLKTLIALEHKSPSEVQP